MCTTSRCKHVLETSKGAIVDLARKTFSPRKFCFSVVLSMIVEFKKNSTYSGGTKSFSEHCSNDLGPFNKMSRVCAAKSKFSDLGGAVPYDIQILNYFYYSRCAASHLVITH